MLVLQMPELFDYLIVPADPLMNHKQAWVEREHGRENEADDFSFHCYLPPFVFGEETAGPLSGSFFQLEIPGEI
jgi:hypothetical protein